MFNLLVIRPVVGRDANGEPVDISSGVTVEVLSPLKDGWTLCKYNGYDVDIPNDALRIKS